MVNTSVKFYGPPKNRVSAFSRFRRLPFLPGRRLNLQYDLPNGALIDISPAKSQCKSILFPKNSVFVFRGIDVGAGNRLNLQYDSTNGTRCDIFSVKSICNFYGFLKMALRDYSVSTSVVSSGLSFKSTIRLNRRNSKRNPIS